MLLSDVTIGDTVEIETFDGTYWVTPVKGRWVGGVVIYGLQITSGDPGAIGSLCAPSKTGALNEVREGEIWSYGFGRATGGLVKAVRVL